MNAILKAIGPQKPQKQRLAYSLIEAAEATSLSRRTLEYLIKQGKLRAVKVGSRTLIPAKSLERLVNGE